MEDSLIYLPSTKPYKKNYNFSTTRLIGIVNKVIFTTFGHVRHKQIYIMNLYHYKTNTAAKIYLNNQYITRTEKFI